ncbi:MAG: type IV pili methyl-accepting chemotaxis transducer N-terminal domain-containing protein, partial [Rhodoferax sp.]|nr:type IV pili methyl-accepting chemotaxis transducer N-terminal domain-containing protein [Rhodoferax sp.]
MSVVDQLKRLITKKAVDPSLDSLQMLDGQFGNSKLAEADTVQSPQAVVAPARVSKAEPAAPGQMPDVITMPFLGARSVTQHQRILSIILGASLLLLAGAAFYGLNESDKLAQQVGATGRSLTQSQRLAKSVSQAMVGNVPAFADVAESASVLARATMGLKVGDEALRLSALDAARYDSQLSKIVPLVERAEKSAKAVLAQQKVLTQVGTALRQINRHASDLLEIAESISTLKVQQSAPA